MNHDATRAVSTKTQCLLCQVWWQGCITWTYIDERGPYCEDCMKTGVWVIVQGGR